MPLQKHYWRSSYPFCPPAQPPLPWGIEIWTDDKNKIYIRTTEVTTPWLSCVHYASILSAQ